MSNNAILLAIRHAAEAAKVREQAFKVGGPEGSEMFRIANRWTMLSRRALRRVVATAADPDGKA